MYKLASLSQIATWGEGSTERGNREEYSTEEKKKKKVNIDKKIRTVMTKEIRKDKRDERGVFFLEPSPVS
jgi:hypothetical protein